MIAGFGSGGLTQTDGRKTGKQPFRSRPVADIATICHFVSMYRKDADRLIVRDIEARLPKLRKQHAWASWRLAVSASASEHPDWYRHHQPSLFDTVEALLLVANVNMSEPALPGTFTGNLAAED